MSEEPELDVALRLLLRTIVKHPIAAQAAYAALVREGRAYAQLPEGAELRARLAASEATARVRTAWEILTVGMLEHEAKPGAVPSVLVEALVRSAARTRFEAKLRGAVSKADD